MVSMVADVTTPTDTTPVVELLSSVEESEAVGRHASLVSRRRSQDPKHPAYRHDDGHFTDSRTQESRTGKMVIIRAPSDAIAAYWAPVRKGAGRPPVAPVPAGLPRAQWAALQAHAAGGPLSDLMRRRLTAAGMLDAAGDLTDTARGHLATVTTLQDGRAAERG